MAPTQSGWVLSDDLLERCAQRAAGYDRENRFFFEDFEELREAKYLLAAVPKEFGGLGLTLSEICQEQRRLARRSAPTALATNMHLLATGVAADLWHKGDKSQAWMLEEAARGAVFAYGYSESGNDLEVLYAAGRAERVGPNTRSNPSAARRRRVARPPPHRPNRPGIRRERGHWSACPDDPRPAHARGPAMRDETAATRPPYRRAPPDINAA
jgi:Acyl-CoA dehydrogenase, N-terminal domain